MRKRHILWPAFCLILAVLWMSATTAWAEEASEFTYDGNNQRLAAYNGAGGNVTVPAEVDGAVVEVLYGTFNSNESITGVALPDTLKVLDSSSVYALSNLTEIALPEGLEIIGDYNFWLCDALAEVTVPSTVAYIGNNCFYDCESMTGLTFTGEAPVIGSGSFTGFSENVTIYVPDDQLEAYQAVLPSGLNIEPSGQNAVPADHTAPESDFAFDAATGTITAINSSACYLDIPDTIGGTPVKAIGDAAAAGHTCNAYRITIPEGVESIGNEAFSTPNHLVWVDLPSTLRNIGDSAFYFYMGYQVDLNEGLESIGTGAFASSSLAGELHLPTGLKTIAPEAFQGAFRLTDVYFPDTVETIGANAFTDTGVTYLNFADTKIPQIDAAAFEGLSIADVDMDWHTTMEEVKELQATFDSMGQESATVWSNNPSAYGVASLVGYNVGEERAATYTTDSYLESYSGTVEDVTVYTSMDGNHVIGLGAGCFKDNQVIRSFYPHHGGWFTTIQEEAFAGSTLESIELFDSITTIGDGAFRDCKNLTEITLPASLTSIGEGAFDGCDNLQKVNVLCSAEILPDAIFANCTSLKEDTEGILLAADVADDQIERLSAGMGLPWSQSLLREGETRPELITMPFTPTDTQYFEFDAETGTITGYTGTDADVIVPREIDGVEVKAIGYNAFENCRDYTNTDIETNQTRWTPLRSIVLPETVTEISDSAFSYCQQLETFICYGPAESTGKRTFSNCRHLERVIFVNGVGMIDNYAFENTDWFETFYTPVPMRYLGESAFLNSGVQEFVIDATSVGNSAFWNCGSLFELHFTDHVKQVNAAVANSCEYLYEVCFETMDLSFLPNDGIIAGTPGMLTVRVPEETDEENLEKANHVLMWGTEGADSYVSQEACDRTPAELPDIEAILQGYADDPYEAPDFPEAKVQEPIEAEPVGEAGKPYLGAWILTELKEGGESYSPADLNMEGLSLILNEDGTCEYFSEQEGAETFAWNVSDDGVAHLDTTNVTVSDGKLVVEEDGFQMIFDSIDMDTALTSLETAREKAHADLSDGDDYEDAYALDADDYEDAYALDADDYEGAYALDADDYEDAYALDADDYEDAYALDADDYEDTYALDTDDYADGLDEIAKSTLLDVDQEVDQADPENYVGIWHGVYIEAGLNKGDPRQMWGLEITLTLNEDGTGDLDYGGSDGGHIWGYDEEAQQMYYGLDGLNGQDEEDPAPMPLFILNDGFLRHGTPLGGYIVFSKDENAAWEPTELPETSAADNNPAAGNTTTDSKPAEVPLGKENYLDKKYVCTSAESGGVTLDASLLGGEYSVILKTDGTLNFIMAGTEVPGLSWKADGNDFVADYFGQGELRFVPSGDALSLDFFGGMSMTFEAE